MAKYLFVYHGGDHPETEAEVKEVLDAWGAWMGSMGAAVIDGGNPVGKSSTTPSGNEENSFCTVGRYPQHQLHIGS